MELASNPRYSGGS